MQPCRVYTTLSVMTLFLFSWHLPWERGTSSTIWLATTKILRGILGLRKINPAVALKRIWQGGRGNLLGLSIKEEMEILLEVFFFFFLSGNTVPKETGSAIVLSISAITFVVHYTLWYNIRADCTCSSVRAPGWPALCHSLLCMEFHILLLALAMSLWISHAYTILCQDPIPGIFPHERIYGQWEVLTKLKIRAKNLFWKQSKAFT